MSAITTYLTELRAKLATGDATEHTHRPALQRLLEGLQPGLTVVNEPRHTEAGAVDFIAKRGEQPIGWLEAKDIGADLGKVAKTDQLKRYLGAYPNLILTDYVTFRLYLNGKLVDDQALGVADGTKITSTVERQQAVASLLDAFLSQEVYRPGKPEDLASRMAYFARMAEAAIIGALTVEGERGQLHSQMAAFRETLLPDLSEEQFADMYAQTIAYGLFAAKCHHPLGDDFSRWTAARYLPPTNPFLQRLFHELTGPDLDPEVEWVVDGLVSLLRNTEMQAIVEAFARHQQGREDPVVHFYETFLKEYNPRERKIRGVYYTPEPVVSYIVRSVDHLLKTEFDKPLGLADDSVFILDPACGTGTFLYFVIEHIHNTITHGGRDQGVWPGYVRDKLLGRLFGFELLMAPYTIAHLKLAQLLREQGYDFPDDQRLGIYLTNTLEEARFRSETLVQRYISEEAEAAAEVKKHPKVMVVLGNPPYSVSSQNRGEWIQGLLADYKHGLAEKKLNLDDDYIKFVRFGQWRIDQTGYGILAFVTNHSYIDGLTHRRMRESLLSSFDDVRVLNLHGDSKKKETAPDGSRDENVFDIQQGVAVALFAKRDRSTGQELHYLDVWGTRDGKYEFLEGLECAGPPWQPVEATPPAFYFLPKRFDLSEEYQRGWSVPDAFPVWQTGLTSDRDELFYDFLYEALRDRMRLFFSGAYDGDFRDRYNLKPSSSYDAEARRDKASYREDAITKCLYRPYDPRWMYYDPKVTSRPVYHVMRHMLRPNIGLIATRQTRDPFAVLTTDHIMAHKAMAAYDRNSLFPLYVYPEEGTVEQDEPRRPNLNPAFVADLAGRLGLTFIEDACGDLGRDADGTPDTPVGPDPDLPGKSAGRTDEEADGIGREVVRRRHHLPHWQLGGSYYWLTSRSGRGELPPSARQIMRDTLKYDHGRRYDLIAAVVMPDHVHAVLRPLQREPGRWFDLAEILKLVKGVSARRINQLLATTGQVWFSETWDRIIRNEDEYNTFLRYLVNNPVKRELVSAPEDYEFTIWPGECQPSGMPDTLVGHSGDSPDRSVGRTDGHGTFGPEDVFHYIYAVLHSPTYRSRYAEFLKIDFPRIPLTSNLGLFRRLCGLGAELVALHLLKSPLLAESPATYPEQGSNLVEAVRYDEADARVHINKTQYFGGIAPALYEFQVGGYQVMNKWLKDRKGRTLSYDDIQHYQRVAAALTHTMRLMQEIDAAIPQWPLT